MEKKWSKSREEHRIGRGVPGTPSGTPPPSLSRSLRFSSFRASFLPPPRSRAHFAAILSSYRQRTRPALHPPERSSESPNPPTGIRLPSRFPTFHSFATSRKGEQQEAKSCVFPERNGVFVVARRRPPSAAIFVPVSATTIWALFRVLDPPRRSREDFEAFSSSYRRRERPDPSPRGDPPKPSEGPACIPPLS